MAAEIAAEREITVEELAVWFTPMEACAYAVSCVGLKGAGDAIWHLLRGGMIEAVATSSSMTLKDQAPITDTKPSFIPKRFWKDTSNHGTDLWNGGYARFWIKSRGGVEYRCFGIKLNPHDVRANLPPPNPALHSPKPAETSDQPTLVPSKGGRPRKDFWDDLWIDR